MTFNKFARELYPFLRGDILIACIVGLIFLAEMAFNGALPYSFKFIVDDAILKHDGVFLALMIAGLAIAALLTSGLNVVRDYLYARMTADTVGAIRYSMFSHLQYQSLGFFSRAQMGDLLSRFSGDLNAIEHALVAAPGWIILPLLNVISHAILLFMLEWRLALVSLLVCPIIIIGPKLVVPRATDANTKRRTAEGGVLAAIQENLAAQSVVKALTYQEPALLGFLQHNRTLSAITQRVGFLSALVERSAGSGILLMQVAITGIGAYMVYDNVMTLGDLVAFQALFGTLASALMYIAQYVPTLIQAAGGMARVAEILTEESHVSDRANAEALPSFSREIRFRDVTFGYTDAARNLSNVDLVIKRGENVAFVGPSGSGKSTIVNLVMRFYDPQSGTVCFDDHDIKGVTQSSLRDNTAIVFQENFLFNISLRENIRIGRPSASDEEVAEAARVAEIHDFITTLPQGYETPAGERGSRLSGGQRQRIGIARALLRDPKILILDEATSALDPATETSINATLKRVAENRTVISVTHRLGSVTDCDRIFVMERGQLKETGTHDELLAQGGLYASLHNKQDGVSVNQSGDEAKVAASRLRAIPVLEDMAELLLSDLARQFATEQYPAGRMIFEEGDAGDRFYLLVHGSVEVLKSDADGNPKRVVVLQDGDYFGEIALLSNVPRTASIRTLSHCLLLSLQRTHFNLLLERAPDLHARLMERYAKTPH